MSDLLAVSQQDCTMHTSNDICAEQKKKNSDGLTETATLNCKRARLGSSCVDKPFQPAEMKEILPSHEVLKHID